jgi:hypothetical protein
MRKTRGSVPVEYVALFTVVSLTVILTAGFPDAFSRLMVQSARNMNVSAPDTYTVPDSGFGPTDSAEDSGISDSAEDTEAPSDSAEDTEAPTDSTDDTEAPTVEDSGTFDVEDDTEEHTCADPRPPRSGCNQGIGNGAEGCDPGNSGNAIPWGSNDEPWGGIHPGRRR